MQMMVTLNTCCDVACLTFKVPHNTTGCLRATNVWRGKYAFHQTNEFCTLQGSAVTFLDVVGKFTTTAIVTVCFIVK